MADLFDRVFHGGAKIAASHVERDGYVPDVAFVKDVVRTVLDFYAG